MPGCFFYWLCQVSHSNRGVAYVKGEEIILVILYHFSVFISLFEGNGEAR